jgi:hypothetical protein
MTLAEATAAAGIDDVGKIKIGNVELSVHLSAPMSEPDRYHALNNPIAAVESDSFTGHLHDFEELKLLLTEKYGIPTSDTRKARRDGCDRSPRFVGVSINGDCSESEADIHRWWA